MKLAFVLLLLISGGAFAQRAEQPAARVGDQWHFAVHYTVPSLEPNRLWIVKSVNASGIEGTENGEPLLLTPELNVLETPRFKYLTPRELQFPLEVGKRWSYVTDWVFKPKMSKGNVKMSVEVVAYEKLKVAAGEFDTFKLVAKGSLGGNSPSNTFYAGDAVTTYWYAPAARAIVKSMHHSPYQGPTNFELVSFKLQP